MTFDGRAASITRPTTITTDANIGDPGSAHADGAALGTVALRLAVPTCCPTRWRPTPRVREFVRELDGLKASRATWIAALVERACACAAARRLDDRPRYCVRRLPADADH
jgi:hypothetical protein